MSRRHRSRSAPPIDVTPAPVLTPCPGQCNRAWVAAEEAATTERATAAAERRLPDRAITDHGRTPRMGHPVWCVDEEAHDPEGKPTGHLTHTGCTTRIRRDLERIPDLAAYLTPGRVPTPRDTVVDDGRGGGNARSAATFPSLSPAWDTADEVIRWGCTMADTLATRVGDNRPAFTRLDNLPVSTKVTVVGAITYIANRFPQLMESPEAEPAGRAIRARARTLERMVGADTLTHHIAGECPVCKRRGRLYRKDGDDFVRCGGCAAIWDWDHFQLLVRIVLSPPVRARELVNG